MPRHESGNRDIVKNGDALDAKQGIVFGYTLASGGSTGFDLADAEGNDEVSDDSVFGLTTTVRDHDTPAIRLSELSPR
jgi:hypothetical protein